MKFSRNFLLKHLLMGVILFLTACQPGFQVSFLSSGGLPQPKKVSEAALVNFRPITDTGRSFGAVWSPDGLKLAYSELSFVPSLLSYKRSNNQPKTEVWEVDAKGESRRMLDLGIPMFYNKDGSEIFYQVYDPADGSPSVYAINPETMKTRHFLGTQGYPSVYALKDGRLVLSEVGTYEPLRILNPTTGEREALMVEHPANAPQDARLSPDGKLLAYPRFQTVIISKPDGSSPVLVSDYGGGPPKVWWSPDSRHLVISTGVSQLDRLVLTDREGKNQVSLIPFFSETGIVTSVVWSPDSRWFLVSAESITAYESPTKIFLFDRSGNRQLLVESYISAPPAWSPDGRSLALSLWMEPKTEEASFAIWLADLTDGNTAASLPASSVPRPQSTTTPVAVSPSLTPDQVVKNFWESIDQKEYRSAWSMLSERRRAEEQYPHFKAFYECMQQVSISSLQEDQKDEDTIIFSLKIDYQKNPDCDDRWQQPNEIYAILSKASTAAPWHIECISDKQTCLN